jgi:ribose transport system ATP-binding protein
MNEMMGQIPLLRMTGIRKAFGRITVLDGVGLEVRPGESVALIGENGAGKSTFCRILTGVMPPDEGEIALNGHPVHFSAPRQALKAGLAFIPQELAYVPGLSVAENIMLNRWSVTGPFVRQRELRKAARRECDRFGVDLGDLSRPMSRLRLAERQIVEIVKALSRNAQLIVLDEPTAALSVAESRSLFQILGRLTAEGKGVVYISHRMDEVFEFSDRVAVLRNGRMVADRPSRTAKPALLIADMLGSEMADAVPVPAPDRRPNAAPALSIRDMHHMGQPDLQDIRFDLWPGEILALYGVRGSGADLVAEALGGLRPEIKASVTFNGRTRGGFRTPLEARKRGLAYVPAERKTNGLVMGHSIRRNLSMLTLDKLSCMGFMRHRSERDQGEALIESYDIRCRGLSQIVCRLSGGNQQKVLLASRMVADPQVLVLQEPTRGVDIGARAQIHETLRKRARAGLPMLVVTSDLEEAVALSDRLLVMREGALVGELEGAGKTQQAAIALAAGPKIEETQ